MELDIYQANKPRAYRVLKDFTCNVTKDDIITLRESMDVTLLDDAVIVDGYHLPPAFVGPFTAFVNDRKRSRDVLCPVETKELDFN